MNRLLLGVPVMALAAACSTGGSSGAAPTNVPSLVGGSTTASGASGVSPSPSPTRSVTTKGNGAPTPSASASPGPCVDGQLTVGTAELDGGLSHAGLILLFTNGGSTSCTVTGYPGAAGLDASGKQIVQAKRTPSGYLGGATGVAPVVTVAPGAVASARIEGIDGQVNSTPCPTVTALLVTPPGSHVSTKLSQLPGICSGVEIHPVVAGNTGGAN